MAKLQIKKYGSSGWENYYPNTKVENITNSSGTTLATLLSQKQGTLTFDSSPTQNSDNPVKSSGIFSAISNVRAVAEGKTKTYVTGLYNGQYLAFGSSALDIDSSPTINVSHCREVTDMTDMLDIGTSDTYLYLFDETGLVITGNLLLENLNIGDVLYIIDTDVPDFWFDFPYIYKMETTKVDLEDYAKTSYVTSQFLTGVSYNSSTKKIQYTKNNTTSDIVTLSAVATSGSYSDLSGTPTIPTKASWNYDDVYVKYDSNNQGLTDTQKSNARANIGAGTSSFTGYTSSNKLSTSYIQNDANWTSNTGTVTSINIGLITNGSGLAVGTSKTNNANVTDSGTLKVGLAANYSIVYVNTSAPSNPYTNQIWFDITQ